jgi:hypothetical protein
MMKTCVRNSKSKMLLLAETVLYQKKVLDDDTIRLICILAIKTLEQSSFFHEGPTDEDAKHHLRGISSDHWLP